jgi:hypothetical protein
MLVRTIGALPLIHVRRVLATSIAFVAVLGAASPALAAPSVSQVTNAGNDLYAACTAGTGGFNYVKSEVEPFGVVNPTNRSNIIAVFQQDRWSSGGARGLAAGVSTNGGSSWTIVPLPFSACAANAPTTLQYERASDPWVSFGPGTPTDPFGATAYAVSISFNQSPGKNGNTVGAAVSYDGGATWEHAQSLHGDATTGVRLPVPDSNFQFFHDKESVTADPLEPGHAYVVWDVLIGPNMRVEADLHAQAFTDFTLFSKTTDFGQTWSPARVINTSAHPSQKRNQTIGNVIVVDPQTGTLYNFFNQIFNTGSNAGGNPGGAHRNNVAFQKSTDGGDTWSSAEIIDSLESVGVADPNNVDPRTNEAPAPLRTGDILPAPAIDPETGDLYVVWQDARFSGHDEIVISTSGDGGATWTAPKRVSTPTGQPAFTASVAVSDSGTLGTSGTVGVTYYQLGTTSLGSMPTGYFIKSFSRSAVTSNATDSIDSKVAATTVAGPFNMLDAPFALGYFTGDYEGLATVDVGASAKFVPVFVQGACGASLSCAALSSVTPPANPAPTGNDSTDLFVESGL